MVARSHALSEPLKPALLAAVRAQLAQGEHLTWAASPEHVVAAGPSRGVGKWDAIGILGGGYAALGSGVMIVRTGNWWWLLLPGTLLVLGLAAFLVSRAIETRAQRTRAGRVYGLTTRRALIVDTYPALRVQALPIEAISDVAVRGGQAEVADLELCAGDSGLVFEAVADPARTRSQLLRVIKDPATAEQEIAAAEAYATQMRDLMRRSMPR